MVPVSLTEMRIYKVNIGVPHMVQNPNQYNISIITIVDKDNPEDMFPDILS